MGKRRLTLKQGYALKSLSWILKEYPKFDDTQAGVPLTLIHFKRTGMDFGRASTTRIMNNLVKKGIVIKTIRHYKQSGNEFYYSIRRKGEPRGTRYE